MGPMDARASSSPSCGAWARTCSTKSEQASDSCEFTFERGGLPPALAATLVRGVGLVVILVSSCLVAVLLKVRLHILGEGSSRATMSTLLVAVCMSLQLAWFA